MLQLWFDSIQFDFYCAFNKVHKAAKNITYINIKYILVILNPSINEHLANKQDCGDKSSTPNLFYAVKKIVKHCYVAHNSIGH